MGIFKRKKKNILIEAEQLLNQAIENAKVKCPKCLSTDVAKAFDWNETLKIQTNVTVWRGRRFLRYHCHHCGDYFDVED